MKDETVEELKPEEYEKAYDLAEELGQNADEEKIAEMEETLPSMNKGPVAIVWDKVTDIYNAFMSPDIPKSIKVLLAGSLLYLVLPTDVIPDFIPVAGLLDDVAVLTFVWNELKKLSKSNLFKAERKGIGAVIQDKLKVGYNKAFDYANEKLQAILRKKAKTTLINCVVNFLVFLVACIFISFNNEIATTFASILILGMFLRLIYKIVINIPNTFRILKIFVKEKNVDRTIEKYIKQRYSFIDSLETMKNKIKIFDDIPSLEHFVRMQRKSLHKTLIEVSITIILVSLMFFFLRRYLLSQTDYTFFSLILLPIQRLLSLFVK